RASPGRRARRSARPRAAQPRLRSLSPRLRLALANRSDGLVVGRCLSSRPGPVGGSVRQCRFLRAVYECGALTRIVLCLTLSRTDTTPRLTLVTLVVHVSWTSQIVPRTVAELKCPRVRKLPEPSPQSLRVLGFLAAADALPADGQLSASTSVRSVIGLAPVVCVTLKMPS